MKERIGFIGLGNMGHGIAQAVQKGYPMVVYDINPKAMQPFIDHGAEPASSPKDVAARARIILLSLPRSSIVEQVVLGANGIIEGASKGTLVVDMTTAEPTSSIKVSKALSERQIGFIDAPVTGGVRRALAGNLTVIVGGEKSLLEKCRPVLHTFSNDKNIHHMGPIGSGNVTKIVNNFIGLACLAATGEGMVLATKMGLDPEQVLNIINSGSGQNAHSLYTFPTFILPGNFEPGSSITMDLVCKDIDLATSLGKQVNIPMLIANLIQQICTVTLAEDGPIAPAHSLISPYERWAGVKVRAKSKPPEK